MRVFLGFALALAAAAPAALAQPSAGERLPVNVGGRVVTDRDGAASFGWPGVYFEGRLRGPAVRVRFEAPVDHLRLLVDGEEKAVFRRAGRVDATIAGLSAAEHVVRLEKLTESQSGGSRFIGFFAPPGSSALPPAVRARQIEFIGDSYTVGYGNTSPRRECSQREIHGTTDTQQAFGPLVARRFDADYRIHAYSGFGIVRNYSGRFPELSLPRIYPRLRPDAAANLEAADPRWHPQLIVINLGTNDFSTPVRAGERWASADALRADYRRTYVDFVRRLQARHPQARFILMGSDPFWGEVEQVAAAVNAAAPGRVRTLRFGNLELTGCNYHPSLADDRRLADQLAAAIEAMPELWPAPARR